MPRTTPSTSVWVAVNVVYPFVPFVVEGLIRLAVAEGKLSYDTFSASTLAISVAVLAILVNQSLRDVESPLPDAAEVEERFVVSTWFLILAILFLILFGILILLDSLAKDRHLPVEPVLHIFQVAAFILWTIPVVAAVVAQRSFKLRASI